MISKIRKKLQGINILKTLYVNLAYFPFIQAIKLPILWFILGMPKKEESALIQIL